MISLGLLLLALVTNVKGLTQLEREQPRYIPDQLGDNWLSVVCHENGPVVLIENMERLPEARDRYGAYEATKITFRVLSNSDPYFYQHIVFDKDFPMPKCHPIEVDVDPQDKRLVYPRWYFDSWLNHGFYFRNYFKNERKLIGRTQVWIGCPAALCLSPTVDAMTLHINDRVAVFRGSYYWDFASIDEMSPTTQNAQKLPNELMYNLDAAFRNDGEVILMKMWSLDGNRTKCFDLQGNIIENNSTSRRCPSQIMFAATDTSTGQFVIYGTVESGSVGLWCTSSLQPGGTTTRKYSADELRDDFRIEQFDAAIMRHSRKSKSHIVLLYDWMYYSTTVSGNDLTDLQGPFSSTSDFFVCPDELYRGAQFSLGYEDFARQVFPYSGHHSIEQWDTKSLVKEPRHWIVTRYIAVAMVAILVAEIAACSCYGGMFVWRQQSRLMQRRRQQMHSRQTASDLSLGNKGSRTLSRVVSDLLRKNPRKVLEKVDQNTTKTKREK